MFTNVLIIEISKRYSITLDEASSMYYSNEEYFFWENLIANYVFSSIVLKIIKCQVKIKND